MALKPVSVSQLNSYIKRVLSTDPILANVSVTGEISNLTKHATGHWYFGLKDASSRINCFLSADRAAALRYDISEGMQISVYGYVSVYERGGYYSLNVREIEVAGEGELQKAFENLKNKLEKEGLFDPSHKRPIPSFPHKIAVVTSPTGAAVKDIITTVKRRNPLVDIIIYPCLVQGKDAAVSICSGIEYINRNCRDAELIIAGRGGGSAEDLWAFNEESVARAVYGSAIPVISAVGHERDYVISDYAADLRAATPTAAAELAVPHISDLKDRMNSCSKDRLFRIIEDGIRLSELKLRSLKESCDSEISSILSELSHRIKLLKLDIDSYDPLSVLSKGFAAVRGADSNWITGIKSVEEGSRIEVLLQDGSLNCIVEGKEYKDGR